MSLRGADLASLYRRLRAALGTLVWALASLPQKVLDLCSGLPNYTVLIRLLNFSKTSAEELLQLIYGLVLQLSTFLLVDTLVSEITIDYELLVT